MSKQSENHICRNWIVSGMPAPTSGARWSQWKRALERGDSKRAFVRVDGSLLVWRATRADHWTIARFVIRTKLETAMSDLNCNRVKVYYKLIYFTSVFSSSNTTHWRPLQWVKITMEKGSSSGTLINLLFCNLLITNCLFIGKSSNYASRSRWNGKQY